MGQTAEVGSSTSHLLRACPQGAHSLGAKTPHVLGEGEEVKAKRKAMQRQCGPSKGGAKQAGGGLGEERQPGKALPRPGGPWTKHRLEGCPSPARLVPPQLLPLP